MSNGIYPKIKKRIELSDYGTVFVTSDFADLAAITTVRKCLGRQVEEKTIRRIIDGVYEKPVYSSFLKENVPVNPEAVPPAPVHCPVPHTWQDQPSNRRPLRPMYSSPRHYPAFPELH